MPDISQFEDHPIIIESLDKYIEYISQFPLGIGYRGLSNKDYKLIPTAGRVPQDVDKNTSLKNERNLLFHFRQYAYTHAGDITYFEAAILGQHYGIPTRLLDWTTNPLVAMFFSLNKISNTDSAIYISDIMKRKISVNDTINYEDLFFDKYNNEYDNFKKSKFYKISSPNTRCTQYQNYIDSMNKNDVFAILPKASTPRIIAQSSFFTLHYNPYIPMDVYLVNKIVIPHKCKEAIRRQLDILGIHAYFVSPDLEGLAIWQKQRFFEIWND